MSASSPKRPRKLIADLPKGVSARWVTDGKGRRSVCIRLGTKYTGRAGKAKNAGDSTADKKKDHAIRHYFSTREEAEAWLRGPEAERLRADSTGIAEIYEVAKVAGVPREHLDPEEMRKALTAYRVAKDHGLSITDAVGMAIEKRCPSGKPRTLREACNEVIQNRETNKLSERHLKLMRGIYDAFCVKLGKRPIHEIDYDELDAWRNARSDLSLRTLRSYFTYLSIVFRRGIKRGWCTDNPAAEIKSEIKETPGEVTIITADAMARLLGAAMSLRKELVVPLALKAFAGVRTSELLRLTWGSINESAVQVSRRASKTDKGRRIPHLAPLPAWLRAGVPRKTPADALIVQMKEKPFHQAIAVLAKAAGVKIGPNALRHSFGTYHGHKHTNKPQTAFLMGNSVGVVERDYMNYSPQAKDIRMWWRITPTLAKKEYAKYRKSPKSGGKVARKKRSPKARIHFASLGAAGATGGRTSRKRATPALKKGKIQQARS